MRETVTEDVCERGVEELVGVMRARGGGDKCVVGVWGEVWGILISADWYTECRVEGLQIAVC